MLIYGYTISNPDEADVLADCLTSLSSFCDRIYLVDGGLGGGTLNHHPVHTEPLRYWLAASDECGSMMEFDGKYVGKWNGIPIVLYEHPFADPAAQRNWILDIINRESERPDWIFMLDSDEVASLELEDGIRAYLSGLSPDAVGVYNIWLNLVQDEQHCVGGHHSDWLAHPRIHKPGAAHFSGSWHESMVIDRAKLSRWPVRIVHTRALFRKRLLVQRGHSTIRNRSVIKPEMGPFWDDAGMESVPDGVTWGPITWPDGEIPIPFDADALEYWTPQGEDAHG